MAPPFANRSDFQSEAWLIIQESNSPGSPTNWRLLPEGLKRQYFELVPI